MRAFVCTAVVCACGFPMLAQSGPKKDPPPGVVHTVTVGGNQRYKSADILKAAGLTPGQRVAAPDIERARKRIQDTELFTNVSDRFRYSAGATPEYDITFDVVENAQVFPMRFERLPKPGEAIEPCLSTHVPFYSEEIPAADGVLRRYREAVSDCLGAEGKDLKLRARVSNDDPQQLAIVFTPDTPPPTISQVFVTGNTVVDTGSILRAVNSVAIGSQLTDERVKQVLDGSIKPLYAEKGYPVVTFPKITVEPAKTNKGVILHVQIQEGPLYKFGGIHFRGTGMDPEEVKANISYHPGQDYNGKQVEAFRQWLTHNLRRKGYLDTTVTAETQEDDVRHVMNVLYTVTPGSIYNFGTLDIQGLDIATSPTIERLWGEKPGKPFNPDYPDFFLKRIQDEGLFDNLARVTSDYSADAASHTVTVHLYFKGGKSPDELEKEKKQEEERRQPDTSSGPPL